MEPTLIKEFRTKISRAIRRLREEEGISAQFLAKILGVAQPTISRIERGTTSISAEHLCFLARSFNRPLTFFIGEQSPVIVSEEDVIKAGLVFYGVTHLKNKRSVDVLEHYQSYAAFLNVALKFSDDPRIVTALCATIYKQAIKDNLKILQILSTVTNVRLQVSLYKILEITSNSCVLIKSSNSLEIKRARTRIRELIDELKKELDRREESEVAKSATDEYSKINISPQQIAKFVDEG